MRHVLAAGNAAWTSSMNMELGYFVHGAWSIDKEHGHAAWTGHGHVVKPYSMKMGMQHVIFIFRYFAYRCTYSLMRNSCATDARFRTYLLFTNRYLYRIKYSTDIYIYIW